MSPPRPWPRPPRSGSCRQRRRRAAVLAAAGLALTVCGSGATGGHSSSFRPFAGVEELAPHDLARHCGPKDAAQGGLARCERSVRTRLSDGGDVELAWRMRADPDRMLSLDVAAASGVRLLRCNRGELEVELPRSHAHHARAGTLLVASRFAHRCAHLAERPLYSRVISVRQPLRPKGSTKSVRLKTEEFPSLAHLLPSVEFNFSYMPAEARDYVAYPAMRTDFGQPWHPARGHQRDGRKLQAFGTGYSGTALGGMMSSPGALTAVDALMDLVPKEISNFGWNWNFLMNSTETPEFNYTVPGILGLMKLKQPYIKVHAGLYLNFTSHFEDVMSTPHVKWRCGVDGHGLVNVRMMTDIKTTSSVKEDPFHLFELPVLEQLREILWFKKIDFAVGGIPLSVEPGFQFKTQMYHTGMFDGTIQLGGKTQFKVRPEVRFDSDIGLDSSIRADFKDVDLWPPLWIIATKHFEMGIALQPTVWMRGQFGQVSDSRVGFEMRPYVNLSISRQGSDVVGAEQKSLVVYPFRVVGLSQVTFGKRYKVKISANGLEHTTSASMNWGRVEFHDHVKDFVLGSMSQKAVVSDPIQVSLIEESAAGEMNLGTATVTCHTLLNGECRPTPTRVDFNVDGSVVSAELAIIWQDNPIPWFASRIRAVQLTVPKLSMRVQELRKVAPQALDAGAPAEKFYVHITHAGRTYVNELSGPDSLGTQATFSGDVALELGPTFLEDWMPCGTAACASGRLELFYGTQRIAYRALPEIPWNTVTDTFPSTGTVDIHSLYDDDVSLGNPGNGFSMKSVNAALTKTMFSAVGNVAVGSAEAASLREKDIPLTVALTTDGNPGPPLAVVSLVAAVTNPTHASEFTDPAEPSEAQVGGKRKFAWTVANVNPLLAYTFRLTVLKATDLSAVDAAALAGNLAVDDKVLLPVPGTQVTLQGQCRKDVIDGFHVGVQQCTFEHSFELSYEYQVGDLIVLKAEWMENAVAHVMYSQPVWIVSQLSGRPPAPRRLFTQEEWDKRLAANEENCKEKDLHFRVGFGMLTRAKMEDASLQQMFPMLGEDSQPSISTGLQNLGEDDMIDSDAAKLLPKAFCSDNLCSGKMPGCRQSDFKVMHFPELMFNFNRAFHYVDMKQGHGMLKEILAYAFSTLPEAIELMVETLNGTTTPVPFAGFRPMPMMGGPAYPGLAPGIGAAGAYGYGGAYPMMPQPMMPQGYSYQPAAPAAPAAPGAYAPPPWAARRLRAGMSGVDETSSADGATAARQQETSDEDRSESYEPPQSLRAQQVTMRFKHGIHYRLDKPMVDVMLRHGMFQELYDDVSHVHGPALVTDVIVNDESSSSEEALDDAIRDPHARQQVEQASASAPSAATSTVARFGASGGFAAAAAVAATAAVLGAGVVHLCWRRSRRGRRWVAEDDVEDLARLAADNHGRLATEVALD